MMVALGDLYNPIIDWFRNHPTPPVAIVSYMYTGWTYRVACELGIRHYTFSMTSALSLSVIFSLWRYQPKRDDQHDNNELISFPNIPNSPNYPWWQLPNLFRTYVEGDPTSEFIKVGIHNNIASWGIIVNSFSEIERGYVDHLKDELGHDRVFAVGPVVPTLRHNKYEEVSTNHMNILLWLDKWGNNEVVYICFGSHALLTNKQMEVVALGLEKSMIKFVWWAKEPTGGHTAGNYGRIPIEFEDRVAGRGLVIRDFAPQELILRHNSVGVFLTHCGWKSIMEALEVEVLMLTWPMTADQHINATLLHDLNVGIKVSAEARSIPDSEKLADLFNRSVSEDKRFERDRAKVFGKAAKEAIDENGSSRKELDRLVVNLSH